MSRRPFYLAENLPLFLAGEVGYPSCRAVIDRAFCNRPARGVFHPDGPFASDLCAHVLRGRINLGLALCSDHAHDRCAWIQISTFHVKDGAVVYDSQGVLKHFYKKDAQELENTGRQNTARLLGAHQREIELDGRPVDEKERLACAEERLACAEKLLRNAIDAREMARLCVEAEKEDLAREKKLLRLATSAYEMARSRVAAKKPQLAREERSLRNATDELETARLRFEAELARFRAVSAEKKPPNEDVAAREVSVPKEPPAPFDDDDDDDSQCVVCEDAKRRCAGQCGHVTVCVKCSLQIDQCPICRAEGPWIKLYKV